MILVDTSIWIDYLRREGSALDLLLSDKRIVIHPFVVGELACGNMNNRNKILEDLKNIDPLPIAADDAVLRLIEQQRLMGRGINYIDAHLLTATALAPSTQLWTRDRRLREAAIALGISSPGLSHENGDDIIRETAPDYFFPQPATTPLAQAAASISARGVSCN